MRELLQTEIVNEQSTNINLNLKSGFYFVSLDKNGQKSTRKIIVE
ncbi:MAG: T9SS type A sorting domain-containing protein [Sphingobacteriaceae bacterium]|nr:T9SS type A sorting domain-containing protein [Sphingobacteriaceae bacterium]